MATLTVLKFHTPEGADQALEKLTELQKQALIKIQDAAVVTWPQGKKKPKTRQAVNMAGMGALDGAFWGMLFGLIFFIPFVGLAIGAAMGALAGSFTDIGIDDKFINTTREKVTEGTSALFVLSSDAVVDRVIPELKGLDPEVIASNLPADQEAKLREAFAAE
jgi:uncharacterized membrane protein